MEELAITTPEANLAEAESTVNSYTLASLAVGLLPGGVLDLAALAALQLSLVSSLATTYKLDFSSNVVQSLIGTLLEWTIVRSVSQPLASLLWFVPVVGPIASAFSLSALFAASTYATGKVFTQHFATGGTLLTFDPAQVREHYEEEFQRGLNAQQSGQTQKP